jgi:hypothetical protein
MTNNPAAVGQQAELAMVAAVDGLLALLPCQEAAGAAVEALGTLLKEHSIGAALGKVPGQVFKVVRGLLFVLTTRGDMRAAVAGTLVNLFVASTRETVSPQNQLVVDLVRELLLLLCSQEAAVASDAAYLLGTMFGDRRVVAAAGQQPQLVVEIIQELLPLLQWANQDPAQGAGEGSSLQGAARAAFTALSDLFLEESIVAAAAQQPQLVVEVVRKMLPLLNSQVAAYPKGVILILHRLFAEKSTVLPIAQQPQLLVEVVKEMLPLLHSEVAAFLKGALLILRHLLEEKSAVIAAAQQPQLLVEVVEGLLTWLHSHRAAFSGPRWGLHMLGCLFSNKAAAVAVGLKPELVIDMAKGLLPFLHGYQRSPVAADVLCKLLMNDRAAVGLGQQQQLVVQVVERLLPLLKSEGAAPDAKTALGSLLKDRGCRAAISMKGGLALNVQMLELLAVAWDPPPAAPQPQHGVRQQQQGVLQQQQQGVLQQQPQGVLQQQQQGFLQQQQQGVWQQQHQQPAHENVSEAVAAAPAPLATGAAAPTGSSSAPGAAVGVVATGTLHVAAAGAVQGAQLLAAFATARQATGPAPQQSQQGGRIMGQTATGRSTGSGHEETLQVPKRGKRGGVGKQGTKRQRK